MAYIDWYEIFIVFILFIFVIFSFNFLNNWVSENARIQEQIIKQSNDYIIYKECTEIQGNYYCKGLVE